MAAKRKGGLKLNAICAKLSRQVVYDGSSQNAEGDPSLADTSERGSSHYDECDRPDSDFSESLSLGPSLEDDQKRREAIEKWVNGEYADEPPSPEGDDLRGPKGNGRDNDPPEGVYMVQPKGCSDDEDNGDETEAMPPSQEGSYHDDRDSDSPNKDAGYPPSSETPTCQASFSTPGNIILLLYNYNHFFLANRKDSERSQKVAVPPLTDGRCQRLHYWTKLASCQEYRTIDWWRCQFFLSSKDSGCPGCQLDKIPFKSWLDAP